VNASEPVVLGLPRGGVIVAAEVAHALHAPLDVLVVRKLGVPFHPELAMGAVGEGGVVVLDDELIGALRITTEELASVRAAEEARVAELVRLLRGARPPISLNGRTVIVVDDGVATGSTALAACRIARARGASWLVLSAPVVAPSAIPMLEAEVDELVWLEAPEFFGGVGWWFDRFTQTSDAEVVDCLERNATERSAATGLGSASLRPAAVDRDVCVQIGTHKLAGHLRIPARATGVVLFAHGSGSSARSPRNRSVAASLNAAGIGTLLFDLLSREEDSDRSKVFDIRLLADRLIEATRWIRTELGSTSVRLGYFGASTGAAAALVAAADPRCDVSAIVSRGGRVDLAGPCLPAVTAPTLLIVGAVDTTVLEMNRRALSALTCVTRLEVVPGASHLFEEPGALEQVAALAAAWFSEHLGKMAVAA
jgi:predicted phosphoribosyltransferase/dienelactone hydrolase